MQTRRLQEWFEGSYSSLAYSSGELSRVIVSYCSRQWETHAFSDFGGKMFFLGHNFGSRHTRRSSKSSIDAENYQVSKKSFSPNFRTLDWRPGPVKFGQKKTKTIPFCEPVPREPFTQIKKKNYNRTKKTCCIRRGFEQLSNYSGWRVITKNTRANLLARAVVKGISTTDVSNSSTVRLTALWRVRYLLRWIDFKRRIHAMAHLRLSHDEKRAKRSAMYVWLTVTVDIVMPLWLKEFVG